MKRKVIGIIFALVPGLYAGVIAGALCQNVWTGLVSGVFMFGLGLDIIFGDRKCHTQYRK